MQATMHAMMTAFIQAHSVKASFWNSRVVPIHSGAAMNAPWIFGAVHDSINFWRFMGKSRLGIGNADDLHSVGRFTH